MKLIPASGTEKVPVGNMPKSAFKMSTSPSRRAVMCKYHLFVEIIRIVPMTANGDVSEICMFIAPAGIIPTSV